MRRAKLITACGLAVTTLGVCALPAAAHKAEEGSPFESPGCKGHAISLRNHISGAFGASENPKSSAGPGFFLRQATGEAVQEVKEFCD
jgi:hypothetical protein